MSRTYAVIGWPLGHSLSPIIQQAALSSMNLDAKYIALPTPPGEESARFDDLRQGKLHGLNITIPHKQTAFNVVDAHTSEAAVLGAVNTIVRDGPYLRGHNTDLYGFDQALRTFGSFDPTGVQAVVLGAGGSARAIVYALGLANARSIVLANRTSVNAHALVTAMATAMDMSIEVRALDDQQLQEDIAASTLLVNTTSVGMAGGPAPDQSPVPKNWLHDQLLVFDIVYRPVLTPLVSHAQAAGSRTLGGLEMLVLQGAASFRQWTKQEPPVDLMLKVGRRALANDLHNGAN